MMSGYVAKRIRFQSLPIFQKKTHRRTSCNYNIKVDESSLRVACSVEPLYILSEPDTGARLQQLSFLTIPFPLGILHDASPSCVYQ